MKTFSQTIEELWLMARTRALMNPSDYKVLDVPINETIKKLYNLSGWGFNPVATEAHEYYQRLNFVYSKLSERASSLDTLTLDSVRTKLEHLGQPKTEHGWGFFSQSMPASEWPMTGQAESDSKWSPAQNTPTDGIGALVWNTPIVSFTSSQQHLHTKEYHMTLSLTENNGKLEVVGEGLSLFMIATRGRLNRLVAVARMSERPCIRLIPVVAKFDLNSEVYEIEFESIERAKLLIDWLLNTGYTVIQRPQGIRALDVGPATTVGDMAVSIANDGW